MRALITGSRGFAGTWLTAELRKAGHDPIETPDLDVTDRRRVAEVIRETQPDAVAHLAAVSFPPEAASNPGESLTVAIRGTINLLEALRLYRPAAPILITGSSEVYGTPREAELPLTELRPLNPQTAYALSKAAQESLGLAYAGRHGITTIVTRSFNHTGPGQHPPFVVPTMAERVLALAGGSVAYIPVGNVDVLRDISDVRDVVTAYRQLLELAVKGAFDGKPLVVNVCSGQSVSIRWMIGELCRLAGVEPALMKDPTLVRADEAREIRGDPSLLSHLTGWHPDIPLTQTLADVLAATRAHVSVATG